MARDKNGFTLNDYEIAIKVMTKSKIVQKWARGEAEVFGVSLDTPTGKRFFENKCREQAERLIR